MTRMLPLGAMVGAAVFTAAWLILGFISPGYQLFDLVIEPYSAISQPVSGLGLGVTAPWMNSAFIVSGLAMVLGVVGLARVWPTARLRRASIVLLGCTGIGMIMDGLFTLEAVMLHLSGFLIAIVLPASGFIVAGLSLRGSWRATSAWLLIASPVALGLFALFMVIFDPYSAGDNAGYAGLVQRALITVVLGMQAMLGFTAWGATRRATEVAGPSGAATMSGGL